MQDLCHVKRGVIHSLFSRAKVICEDLKDLNREIQNLKHDPIFNEHPQKLISL
jgi:hypothetical protein